MTYKWIGLTSFFFVLSTDDGKIKRVFCFIFIIPPLVTFWEDTGVEKITPATFKCRLPGTSSSNIEAGYLKLKRKNYQKNSLGYELSTHFNTLFNGDFIFGFFGVLLPISIISISWVKPVLEFSWYDVSSPNSLRLRLYIMFLENLFIYFL